MKYLSLAVLFIIIISCQEQVEIDNDKVSKISLKDFENEKVAGKIISIDDSIEFSSVYSNDTLLLLKTSSKHKEYFKVYSLPNYHFLGNVGERGEAPGQWKFARINGTLTKEKDQFFIWISDELAGYLKKINLTKSLKSDTNTPIYDKELDINGSLFRLIMLTH